FLGLQGGRGDRAFGELYRRFAGSVGIRYLTRARFVAALPGVDGVGPVGQTGQFRFAAGGGRCFRARAVGGKIENLGAGDRRFGFVSHLDVNVVGRGGKNVHAHRVGVFFAAATDGQGHFVGARFS